MSLDVLIFILVLSNLVLVSLGSYFAVRIYSSRERIREGIMREANTYLQNQMDSIKEHPEALSKLLKPVVQKLISDISSEMKSQGPETALSTEQGNPMVNLGMAFIPKKYQFLAQLGLGLLNSRKSSTGPESKNGKNPFE